jgi:rhodanese-related sulfurtransferase
MFWNSIKEIDVPELARRLNEQPVQPLQVIDVRQFGEIASGTVPGARPMPLHTLPLRLNELERDKELVFVCRSGARSAQAVAFLQQQGFDKVYNLRGGMMGWAQHGLPAAPPTVD